MNNEQNKDDREVSTFDGLPYEPGSSAELLNSTHVFTVEILALAATPFVAGDDDLEHRVLSLELRLIKIFKGKLDVDEGQTFTLKVLQHRESELFVTEFHGLWSHLEVEAGVRYVVIAT